MKRAVLVLGLLSLPMLLLLLLIIMLSSGGANALAGSVAEDEALMELLALRKYGVPYDLVMSTTTVLQEQAPKDAAPTLTEVALEFMEIIEVRMEVNCDCTEESHCGCMPAEGEEGTSCDCPPKPAGYNHYIGRAAITAYIGGAAGELDAETLHAAVQAAADARGSGSTTYETLIVSVDRKDYETSLEAAGIKKKLDRRSLMEVYNAAYFIDFINEGAPPSTFYGHYPMPAAGAVTSTFGMRMHPVKKKAMYHEAIDLGTAHHTPVRSVAAGVVHDVKVDAGGDGQIITIYHDEENIPFYTKYGHLSRMDVSKGQRVTQGQVIGLEGGNAGDPVPGLSTGHHLHFEALLEGERLISPYAIVTG